MATILDVISMLRDVDPPLPLMKWSEPVAPGKFPEFQLGTWNGVTRVVPSEALNLPGRPGERSFMYRGQTERYLTCKASLVRLADNDLKKLKALSVLERVKVAELELALRHHPFKAVADWWKLDVDYHGLAQHYAIATSLLDLTSNVEIAAFFAVARWNRDFGKFEPMEEGTGVIYRLDWSAFGPGYSKAFNPVGFGPGLRPARQHAWTFQLHPSMDFEDVPHVTVFEFKHTKAASLKLFRAFQNGNHLYPIDCIASLVEKIDQLPFVTMAAIRHAALQGRVAPDQVDSFSQHTATLLYEVLGKQTLDGYSLQLNKKDLAIALGQARKLKKRLQRLRFGITPVRVRG